MAIAKDGILGGFSGKVGNIVGLTLNGVPIMRAAPKASQKPPTEKQRLQRLKFSLAIEFTKPFLEITQQFFNQSAFSGERRNLLISYTLQNVIQLQDDEFTLLWNKFLVSSGDLSGFHHLDVTLQDESLHLTWQDNSSQGFAQPNDEVHLLFVSENLEQVDFLENIAHRTSTQVTVSLPDWTVEHSAHFYIFMSNTARNQSCTSFYLGKREQVLFR